MNSFTLARADLASYCISMERGYEPARFHLRIMSGLERLEHDENRRLAIVTPPQHGKSTLVSMLFAAWYLGRNPRHSVVVASYAQTLADMIGRRVRNFVDDDRHTAIFPECKLSADSSSISRFDLTAGGSFTAVGREAGLTGRPAHLLIVDDIAKDRTECESKTIRTSIETWFHTVALPRLSPQGKVVIVGTRWHAADLLSTVLNDSAWETLVMPAIAIQDESGFRREGEALWPEVRSLAWLSGQRNEMSAGAWQCLYQCNPVAFDGNFFKREWMREYKEQPQQGFVAVSIDTAYQTGQRNDYSAITVWLMTGEAYYLLDAWRGRVLQPELLYELDRICAKVRPNAVVVENVGRGIDIAYEFRQRSPWPIVPVQPLQKKELRAQMCLPLFEAGKVFIPPAASWKMDYLDEMCGFPSGALHDDWVDSTTMALNYLKSQRSQTLTIFNFLTGEPIRPTDWWQDLPDALRESEREQQRLKIAKLNEILARGS